jgi:tetratricopeptide (TPR) repeat protein
VGAGAALGVGIADRMQRPASLPGLGDRRPLPSQRPAGERRDQLRDRLSGGAGIADRERPSQLPARDWDQIRQDWTDHRDDIRDNWQGERDDWQDKWQDWRDDHYPWYGGWYWGYAPVYWGYWDPLWDEYPAAATMGTTWWDANSLGYMFGCGDYYNPYYSDASAIDYSEPIVTVAAGDEGGQEDSGAQDPSPEVLAKFDQARTEFYQGNYEEALKLVDDAAEQLPHDAVLHEFRSLVLFALGRYPEAAAAIHAVLAVGPGWDWKTLVSLYPDVDTYTVQLRALEAYCNKNPSAAYAHFLLGYQRLSCGFADAALSELRRASALQPEDSVSANLVRSLTPRDQSGGTPSAERMAQQAPKPIPIDELTGTWSATGEGTSKYSMKLDKDGTFTWSFTKGTRREEVKGVFTSEGNVLAMEPDTGGVLLAELKPRGADQLQFKMVGGAPGEAGFDFRRSKTG